MREMWRVWVLAAAVAACAANAAAQSGPSGSLGGRVIDQSQAAVPGVTVTAVNTATNDVRTDVTGGEGLYRLLALPIGTYELTFQLDGFKQVKRTGVLVEAAVPRTIDVQLQVGALTELVTVVADAPVLQRTTPTVARRLSSEEITSVPSRWEVFNVFNTVNFGLPENNFDSVDFGKITNTIGGPRVSQFGVRLFF